MKKVMTFLALGTALSATAQEYAGFRSGNYTGVNGVFFNPANIADSRHKFDFNLFSLNLGVGNDQAAFRLKDLKNTFDGDSLKNQVFGSEAGGSNGAVNVTVHGPSLMVGLGKKRSIAFTTRARAMANIVDIDGKLAKQLTDDFDLDDELPYTINSQNDMVMAVNGWTEFGLGYAEVLMDKKKHFLKGGATLKYLGGALNAYMNIGNLKGTIDEDDIIDETYLRNATGRIAMGFGGVNASDFDVKDLFRMKSSGFGADLGFVYEFRPNYEKYRSDDKVRRDVHQYKLRVSVALLDIGKIKYERDVARSGSYDLNITDPERLSFKDLKDVDVDDFKKYFEDNPQYFTPVAGASSSKYDVALPTSLQIDVDYSFTKNLYLSVASQISLAETSGTKPYNPQYYNGFTLTPRLETKKFGLYLPINYNELTELNAGVGLRFGSVFIGSGSVLSALVMDSKQADVYLGLHFGSLHKKKLK